MTENLSVALMREQVMTAKEDQTVSFFFFSQKPHLDAAIKIFMFTIVLVICVIATSNLLTIIAVVRKPSLRTTMNVLLVNLALGDLSVGVTFPFFASVANLNFFNDSETNCILWEICVCVSLSVSLGSLTAIAVERFVAICYPFKYAT